MKNNIYKIIELSLMSNKKYVSNKNELLKTIVYEDAMNMDKDLLNLLMANDQIKERFFSDINGVLVFDKQAFIWILESKQFLPDSYTKYTNKIGLTNNDKFISKSNEVVLNFPYKDCVLSGGQDRDDQKRKEILYNEIIADDAINKMLSPKIFSNVKRYTNEGIENEITFSDNDNLIIKGNNLISLSTLLQKYENKVKCIYIDPPYNTGTDGFNYNDSFNHSTWLIFIKNRLELAKKLMLDNGIIFVQCDDNEQAYLKVLMDEIFGVEAYISTIIWEKKYSPQNNSNKISSMNDYILVYAKNNAKDFVFNELCRTDDMNNRYKNYDNDSRGLWKTSDFSVPSNSKSSRNNYVIKLPSGREVLPPSGRCWAVNEEEYQKLVADNRIWFGKNGDAKPSLKKFLSEVKTTSTIKNMWNRQECGDNQDAKKEIKKLFLGNAVFDTPKPEKLIKKILDISTDEKDIVLDFFAGSGTTCAVAHKMGRQYIGIEQMDYIEDITVERMKKVIDGEQGGISESVNWQGGGSFVYCELLENAKVLINEIQEADEVNIFDVKDKIYSDDRIVPYITKEELDKADEEFENLELNKKKNILISLVNKNKLYVNYSDIEDETFDISEADKKFTKSFYREV